MPSDEHMDIGQFDGDAVAFGTIADPLLWKIVPILCRRLPSYWRQSETIRPKVEESRSRLIYPLRRAQWRLSGRGWLGE
jgi:hypothetical protein